MATFTNRATLSYNGLSVDSNIVTGTINETLSVTKTAFSPVYSRGDSIVYIINIINSGVSAFNNLTVTDDLGGGVVAPLDFTLGTIQYYVNGVQQPNPIAVDTNPLTITGIDVPAGSNVTLIYSSEVNDFAPLTVGSTIVNTVNVTGEGILTPLTATETITVSDGPELTITKALSPTTVIENGTITYTFVIQNYGNTSAVVTDNVVVTDNFDPVLRNISVTYEGTLWSEPENYTYNAVTGQFQTNEGQITVPAATYATNPDGSIEIIPGSVTLTVTGTV